MTTTHPTPSQGDERRALSILATFVHETWAGAYSWSELEHKARTALERAGLLSLQDVLALSAALAAPQPSQGANVKVGGSTVYVTNNHRRESNRWWATVYPGFDDDDKRVSTEECDAIAKRIADALNAAPHPPVSADAGKGVELAVELRGVAEVLAEGNGFWRSCTGCHELNEGHPSGIYSPALKCHLGLGCDECGGIGAIWDDTDYDAMAEFMANPPSESVAVSATPMPQPEPTSKGDDVAYRYACTLAQAIFDSEYASDPDYASGRVKWGLCDSTAGVLTQIDNMVSGMTRKPSSQQREPQEAAEVQTLLKDAHNLLDGALGDTDFNTFEDEEEEREYAPIQVAARLVMQAIDALSAPQEAGKSLAKINRYCSAGMCVESDKEHEADCPRHSGKEAGKVEPVAEFLGRRRTPEGTTEFWGVMLCDPMQDPPKGSKFYLRPTQQALSDAQKRKLVGNYFADDWAVKAALSMLDDYPAILAAAGGSEK